MANQSNEEMKILESPSKNLVKLERWAILFVGGKDTPTHGEPKSCFNCPHLFSKQKTCELMGPEIRIERVKKDDDLYTPVCGYQFGGKPTQTDSPRYFHKEPDGIGLEWAKGTGTNCYGYKGGAPCKHFNEVEENSKTGLVDGTCDAMLDSDNKVDSDDCCAAHRGPSIPWQEAQKLLKEKEKQ